MQDAAATALDRPTLLGLATALGIGLMLGLLRERHADPQHGAEAGIRTLAIAALAAAVATLLGPWIATAVVAIVGALAVASHHHSAARDAGLTGEVTIVATVLLAMLAMRTAALAAGIGVVIALLVYFKPSLKGLARERLSERELRDGLALLAAALVVLPLLPVTPVDPWGVLVPSRLWRIVVLVMGVGMAGHVATRTLGARWGLPVSGFFAGFASSTAAVAAFGQRSRDDPAHAPACASAALLANLASLMLLASIVGSVAPDLLVQAAPALMAGGATLAAAAALGLRCAREAGPAPAEAAGTGAFRFGSALVLAGVIAVVLLASAFLHRRFGETGALAGAVIAALAELHAAAAGIAQLTVGGDLTPQNARRGLGGVIAASSLAKAALAFSAGTSRYALWVGAGLLAMIAAYAAVAWT